MVDIDDADGKPKSKASPKSKLLPSNANASSPYIGISPPSHRKEAGHHRLNEDKGDAQKTKRHKGSMFAEPNVSEGKRAYADCVNYLEKAASDASDRAETYLQAVNRANKSPSWELPEATVLFKFMHNKYAQLLKDFRLGIVRSGYQDYLWNRNDKSGFDSDNSDDDNSDNSTPSGKAIGDASKRLEEYLGGVKAATEADKSPPWELKKAIKVYKIIQKKEVAELLQKV
jgi:hypothetical protein